jgi:diketogulonate reductase-like aldo/keto reductase
VNASPLTRRSALKLLGAATTTLTLSPWRAVAASTADAVSKAIPATGERIPVIGMGTWRTFNVGSDPVLRDARTEVLKAFFDAGGGMVDNSPMYGSAQEVVGYGLRKLGRPPTLFAAEKIWTDDGTKTREQAAQTSARWGVETLDLLQIHNLAAWQDHLPALRRMKEEGKIRYLGITTSHGSRHAAFEQIMKTEPLDFIQVTYNLTHRQVEQRLLPLAADRGIAVIANRPFDGGTLVKRLKARNARLPEWAAEIDCKTWADFLLKFVVSHPALTCAIPATSNVEHLRENMAARLGRMPDASTRERMVRHVEAL